MRCWELGRTQVSGDAHWAEQGCQVQFTEIPHPSGGLLQKHLLAFSSVILILVYFLEKKKEERKEKKNKNKYRLGIVLTSEGGWKFC